MLSDSNESHFADTTVRKLTWISLALSVMAVLSVGTMLAFNIGYAHGASGHVNKQPLKFDLPKAAALSKQMLNKGFISKMSDATQQAILDKHNELRACHGSPPLTWSAVIASGAQEHADACDNQNLDGLCDHTPADQLGPLGENLASGDGQTGAPGVVSWYSERKDTPDKGGLADENTQGTGHYTQVVWAGATEVGCGINEQQKYLICRYNAGNMAGEFPANVKAAVNSNCDAAMKDDGFGGGGEIVTEIIVAE